MELRRSLITARLFGLLTLHSDAIEIVAWTDSAIVVNRANPSGLPQLCCRSTYELLNRRERLGDARRFVEAGLGLSERDSLLAESRGPLLEYRARLQDATGSTDSAITTIQRGLAETREDHFQPRHSLLWLMAYLQAKMGRSDEAIQAHLQVAGAAFQSDTTHMTELRELWVQRHGSPAGLNEAVAHEGEVSRLRLTFEAPRVDWELPAFKLPNLHGRQVSSASLRGHVAVIDFWGTWCQPCLQWLPDLQGLHRRFRSQGVKFLAVDVEFEPKSLAEQRKSMLAFMRKNHYTIPVVLDLQGQVCRPLHVPAFPTTWVVGRDGRVKFVNAGAHEGSGRIVADQLRSLLDGEEGRR